MHTLPSTYLQKVPEQPEDADNQKNVTRMIQPPLDKTTTVNIPVTITAPPGETTVIPSECPPFCYELARKELSFQGATATLDDGGSPGHQHPCHRWTGGLAVDIGSTVHAACRNSEWGPGSPGGSGKHHVIFFGDGSPRAHLCIFA